jgi:hypothetical protein
LYALHCTITCVLPLLLQADKASYSGMFAKAGSIYDDKEAERKAKAIAEAQRLQKEEEEWNEVGTTNESWTTTIICNAR